MNWPDYHQIWQDSVAQKEAAPNEQLLLYLDIKSTSTAFCA